jgi:hypothetical protein
MKILIAIAILMALTTGACADSFMAVTYDVSPPLGNTRDFTGRTSFRGLSVEGRGFFRPNWSAGVNFGWTTFDEKSNRLEEIYNGHASGNQFRLTYAVPILATLHYYPNPNKYSDKIMHYVGGGAGFYRVERELQYGVYTLRDQNWHFGFCPEYGFMVPAETVFFMFNIKYNYVFKRGGTDAQSYMTFRLGICDIW